MHEVPPLQKAKSEVIPSVCLQFVIVVFLDHTILCYSGQNLTFQSAGVTLKIRSRSFKTD